MKTYLVWIAASLCAAFTSLAQSSLVMLYANGTQTLSNGDVIILTTILNQETKQTVDILNTTNNITHTYKVKRRDVVLNPGADAYFCFGGSCYGPSTPDAPNALTLNGGQKASDLNSQMNPYYPLSADLYENGPSIGYSEVYYKFYNVSNPNDTASFTIKYDVPGRVSAVSNLYSCSLRYHTNAPSITIIRNHSDFEWAELFSVHGQLICRIPCNASQTDVSMEALPAGIYLLKLSESLNSFKIINP